MSYLYELTNEFKQLQAMLEDGEIDEQVFRDTIEGIDMEIDVKAENYGKIIRGLEAQANSLKEEYTRISNRANTLLNNSKRLKETLEKTMRETGKTKIKTGLFSFNIQKNPAKLVVTGDIPEKYLIPQEPKVDTKGIKELLKTQELDFAHLEQSESLRIR